MEIDPGAQKITQVSPSGGEVRTQEDVSGKVRPRIQGIEWRPCDKQIAFDVALKNCTADETFYAPVKAVVKWMRPRRAEVLNADGEIDGKPYWDYSDALGDQALDHQETSAPRRWEIHSPLWGIVLVCVQVEAELQPRTSKIAFISDEPGNSEIYVMDADGSDPTRLTFKAGADNRPDWSPDGTKLAFQSNRDGNYEIYVMNADGSNQTRLTDHPALDGVPAWSPDGSKIAFFSERAHGWAGDIWIMNPDGSDQTPLTYDPHYRRGRMDWSPDGTKLAFDSIGGGYSFDIWVMDADGSNQINLTSHYPEDTHPVWSPDGTKIGFSSDPGGNREVCVMNADGSGLANLTNHPAYDADTAWSPDGTKIAFFSDRDGSFEIYVMNADGSNPVRLTNMPTSFEGDPAWSPWLH
jgi:Tol biopolymer transport system component